MLPASRAMPWAAAPPKPPSRSHSRRPLLASRPPRRGHSGPCPPTAPRDRRPETHLHDPISSSLDASRIPLAPRARPRSGFIPRQPAPGDARPRHPHVHCRTASVGQWWIRAATSRLRHVPRPRPPAGLGPSRAASCCVANHRLLLRPLHGQRPHLVVEGPSASDPLPRAAQPSSTTRPLGPARQQRDELLRDVSPHLPGAQARGA